MDIICAILTGFHYLMEKMERFAARVKISKRAEEKKQSFC